MRALLRSLPIVAVAFLTVSWSANFSLGQETPTPPAGGATASPSSPSSPQAIDPQLLAHVNDFWHYGKIARYDLAAVEAQEIFKLNASPADVLVAFEDVTGNSSSRGYYTPRQDVMTEWLLKWQLDPKMKDVTSKLLGILEEGRKTRRENPAWIRSNIDALSLNERAFTNHIANLRQSGEFAVPFMVDYLRDGTKKEMHATVCRALQALGRTALNPLVTATECNDPAAAIMICSVLGNLGYADAAPYLVRVANSPETSGAVRDAANAALAQLGIADAKTANASALFYDLAERFYYGNASIVPDLKAHVTYIWFWDDSRGLTYKTVPPVIFGDLMSMRSSEYALKLDPNQGKAISLWLAANFKREADLSSPDAGPGAVDPTRATGQPSGQFYASAAGVQYVNLVVDRALKDHNSAVALAAIKSLEGISGQANLFDSPHQPIIDALSYPDRVIRFEAADALAGALPKNKFAGQDMVVPTLAEALQQSGKSYALILAATQDQLNALREQLKTDNYISDGSTTAEAAINQAAALPGVDIVIISEDAPQAQRDQMEELLSQNSKLRRTARLFITATKGATPYAARAATEDLVNVTTSSDAAGLAPALQSARQRSGALSLDEKLAAEYAIKSATLLGKLAISHDQVLDLSLAQTSLLGALDDSRADVAKASAAVLSLMPGKDAQAGLAAKAVDDKTADDLKIVLFKSLAASARSFGDQLEQPVVNTLTKVIQSTASADVRTAASEAFGALNLPPDQARVLILQQSHTSPAAAPASAMNGN